MNSRYIRHKVDTPYGRMFARPAAEALAALGHPVAVELIRRTGTTGGGYRYGPARVVREALEREPWAGWSFACCPPR